MLGVVHGLQAFLPRMRAQEGEAHVVNTRSMAGLIAPRGLPIGVYTATKYGVAGLSETLRMELEPEGIGVSVLCPGGVETRIWEAERNRPAELGGPQAMDASGDFSAQGALSEQLDPEEVGRMLLAEVQANQLYAITHPETQGLVRGGSTRSWLRSREWSSAVSYRSRARADEDEDPDKRVTWSRSSALVRSGAVTQGDHLRPLTSRGGQRWSP